MTRIEVCVLPGLRAAGWRRAIVEAAQAIEPKVEVVFSEIEHRPAETDCDHVVLLSETPDVMISWVQEVASASFPDACRHVSVLLAKAAVLAGRGVQVLRQEDEHLEIAGVGLVNAPQRQLAYVERQTTPLAFYEALPPSPGRVVEWNDAVFLGEEPCLARKDGELRCDLTGRSRVLRYGPYFHLSPGLWTICVRIAVHIEGSPADLRFEWGVDHDVTTVSQSVSQSGVFEVILSKRWVEAAPSELRVWLDRAMFDGAFEIQSCSVSLEDADQTD